MHVPVGASLDINSIDGSKESGSLTATGGSKVSADTGSTGGAGIGGGYGGSGGTIKISGGTVEANGGNRGAGIGGGYGGSGGTIKISGGMIETTGGNDGGAGIGCGEYKLGSTIEISGGTVIANGGSNGVGIGSGKYGYGEAYETIRISGTADVTANGGENGAGIGGGSSASSGIIIEISGGTVEANGGSQGAGIGGGYYGSSGGTIEISGGTVETNGGYRGAGIGGGYNGSGGIIKISGGTVEANGGNQGAGIGGGYYGSGGTIKISGGTVEADGGNEGAGIGGGYNGPAGTIEISGGKKIEVTGGNYAAGIGSGTNRNGDGGTIKISGGTVDATGGYVGAGIGSGYYSMVNSIEISGGTVKAEGISTVDDISKYSPSYSGPRTSVVIDGGSVWAVNDKISPAPKNSAGDDVYANTLTLSPTLDENTAITAGRIDGTACDIVAGEGIYGIRDVKTNASSQVCFWLPVNSADTAGVTLGTSTARYGFDYTRATADPQSATLYSVAVNYALDGGKYDGENAVPTVYAAWNEAGLLPGGSAYDAENMTKAGYTFDGWEVTSEGVSTPETGIDSSLTCSDLAVNTDTTSITLTAQWTANDDTPYIVEHYLISSAGTVKNTENLTGTTDTPVTATAKNYAGYRLNAAHSDAVPTGTIAGDGTLVLKLYYQINTYIVTFTDGQGTTLKTQIVEYGNAAAAPAENPGRDGYIFDGWDREFGRVTGNLVITAQWSEASGEDSGTENNTNTPTPPQPGTDTNGGSGSGGGGSTPTADAGTPAQARTGTTGAPGNATAATATGTEIGDTDTPLSDVPGNDVGSENDADKGPAPSTDTEINPSDTPLAGGSGQASALGTALPIAGAALAAALLSIFFILFLRRRKRDEEEA